MYARLKAVSSVVVGLKPLNLAPSVSEGEPCYPAIDSPGERRRIGSSENPTHLALFRAGLTLGKRRDCPLTDRVPTRWPLIVWLAIIAGITLVPGRSGASTVAPFCLLCGRRGLADFILNVGLFLPFGAVLGYGNPLLRTVGAAAVFSAGIELAQIGFVAGRDANLSDFLANTLGAGIGWWVLRGWRFATFRRPLPLQYGFAGVAGPVVLLLLALTLHVPALPRSTYHAQWTARFGHMHPYGGEIMAARVGDLELGGPPWRIAASDSVRKLLSVGAELEIAVIAGPPTAGLAPLFSIYDGDQREIVLVGVHGSDIVYRHRALSHRIRLDGGDVRVDDALEGVGTGDSLRLVLTPLGADPCIRVDGRLTCGSGFTIGTTWMLLYSNGELGVPGRRLLATLWLMLLFAPAGVLIGGRREVFVLGAPAIAILWIAPLGLGSPLTPWWELAAVVSGLSLGHYLGPRLQTRSGADSLSGSPPP